MLFVVTSFNPSAEDRVLMEDTYSKKFGQGKPAFVIPHVFEKTKNGKSFLTEVFAFSILKKVEKDEEGYLKGAVLGIDLNVTAAFNKVNEVYSCDLKVPSPSSRGDFSHGHQNLRFEDGDPLWASIKEFCSLSFKEDGHLNYQVNPTPLMIEEGIAVIELVGIIPAKDESRQDSYKIKTHLLTGQLCCKNAAQAFDSTQTECSFAKTLLSKYHNS